jgi:PAS domain S-box-containing protein
MDSSHRLLETIMRNTRNLVYVRDLDGRFTFVNGQVCRAFALPEDQIIGKTPFDICPDEVARAWLADDHRVAEAATGLSLREELSLPDGLLPHPKNIPMR